MIGFPAQMLNAENGRLSRSAARLFRERRDHRHCGHQTQHTRSRQTGLKRSSMTLRPSKAAYQVLEYQYVSDTLEKRGPHRETHLRLAQKRANAGQLVLAGAAGDPVQRAIFIWKDTPKEIRLEGILQSKDCSETVSGRRRVEAIAPHCLMQRSGFLRGEKLSCTHQSSRAFSRVRCGVIEARYRGRGTDLSRVPEFQRHETDTGSPEVQIALLSARVTQLSAHLKENRKDYATRRGLEKILSRRRHFMQYLYDNDRDKYENVITSLNVRPLRIQAGQNVVVRATEEGLVVVEDEEAAGGESQNAETENN